MTRVEQHCCWENGDEIATVSRIGFQAVGSDKIASTTFRRKNGPHWFDGENKHWVESVNRENDTTYKLRRTAKVRKVLRQRSTRFGYLQESIF